MKTIIFIIFCAIMAFSNSMAMENTIEIAQYEKKRKSLARELEEYARIVSKNELSETEREEALKIMDNLLFNLNMLDPDFRKKWFDTFCYYDNDSHILFRKSTLRIIKELE
ncbi:MAG: hypothetical protein IJ730_04910 [Alphaproteobacteria bacterium]|nr:hypothetical protein [Alphaproteobacteria bacterium]